MKNCIFVFCFLLFGCTGYQYVASPQYVPVNIEKGKLTANFSFDYYQLGYTLTNHFSIYTTGYFRNNNGGAVNQTALTKENSGAYIQTDKHKEFDLGFTFYKNLGSYLSYEIVSGIGNGISNYSNSQDLMNDYKFSFNAKKLNIYIQPDLSFRYNKYFDFTVFSRLNNNRYFDINKSLTLGDRTELDKYDKYFYDRHIASLLSLEPGFQMRVGFDKIKFQFMYSKTIDLNNTGIQYRQDNLYFGLSVKLNLIKKP